MTRFLRLLAVLACFSLVVAACGDSGGTTTAAGGDDGQSQSTSGNGDDDGGGDDGGTVTLGTLVGDVPGVSDECVALANVFASMAQVSLVLAGQAEFDEDDVRAQLDQARRGLPSNLQPDIDTLADAMIGYFALIGELEIDFSDPQALATLDPSVLQQLTEAAAVFDTDAVNAASENLSNYGEAECPVDQ